MQPSIFLLSDPHLWNKIHFEALRVEDPGSGPTHWNFKGVYKIIATKNNKAVPIGRVLKKDRNGILYIGRTAAFNVRLLKVLKSSFNPYYIKSGKSPHSFGFRYISNPAFSKLFPYEGLYLELTWTEDHVEFEKVEFKKYLDEFGELPPLNHSF